MPGPFPGSDDGGPAQQPGQTSRREEKLGWSLAPKACWGLQRLAPAPGLSVLVGQPRGCHCPELVPYRERGPLAPGPVFPSSARAWSWSLEVSAGTWPGCDSSSGRACRAGPPPATPQGQLSHARWALVQLAKRSLGWWDRGGGRPRCTLCRPFTRSQQQPPCLKQGVCY